MKIITVTIPPGGSAVIPDLSCEIDVTDSRTPPHLLLFEQSLAPGECVPCGIYPITVTVTDGDGNKSTCEVSFRVECGVSYYNTQQVANCPAGQVGDSVTVVANTVSSTISQADADAQALAAAEAQLICCNDTANLIAGNLNSAVYDPVRDVIWGTGTPGHILKFNATTGALIQSYFVFGPDWSNDGTIAYCPETDRLYTSVRLSYDFTNGIKYLHEIHPDTLAITNSKTLSSYDNRLVTSAFGFIRTFAFNGKLILIAYTDSGNVVLYIITPSNLALYATQTLSNGSFGDATFENQYDPVVAGVANLSHSIYRMAIDNSVSSPHSYQSADNSARNLFGICWCPWNRHYYCASATQFVVKTQRGCTGATEINLGRPNADPYSIRYNIYDRYIYVPLWQDNAVAVISPVDDSFTVLTGFDSPFEMLFTPTKVFAVQHSREGLKQVVHSLPVLPAVPADPPDPAMVKKLLSYYSFDETASPWLDSKGTNHLTSETMELNGDVQALAIQGDGKIVVGGTFTNLGGVAKTRIARINPSGAVGIDPTFTPGASPSIVKAIAFHTVAAVDYILVGGDTANRLLRLDTAGVQDGTFLPAPNNNVRALAIQADQKVIVGGQFTNIAATAINRLARLATDGSFDAAWNPGGTGANGSVFALGIQGDGKIIVGGAFTTYNDATNGTTTINRIMRINTNGTIDLTFNPGTGANNNVNALTIQGDGKIIIAGDFTTVNGTTRNRIARLNTDGTLDGTFDAGTTFVTANNSISNVLVEGAGTILLSLDNTVNNTGNVYRLTATGTTSAFGTQNQFANNSIGPGRAIAIQSNGKVIYGRRLAGSSPSSHTLRRFDTALLEDATFAPALAANSMAGVNGNAILFNISAVNSGVSNGASTVYIDPRKGWTITVCFDLVTLHNFVQTFLQIIGNTVDSCGFFAEIGSQIRADYFDYTYNGEFLPSLSGSVPPTAGTWYFLRLWLDPSDRKLRFQVTPTSAGTLNGTIYVSPRTFDKAISFSASRIRLAHSHFAGTGHDFAIDGLAIYEGALSDADAAINYGAGVPPSYIGIYNP